MLKLRTCEYCGYSETSEDGRRFSNHVKWCLSNPGSARGKTIECTNCGAAVNRNNSTSHRCLSLVTCKQCGTAFRSAHGATFCSNSCAAVHNNRVRVERGLPSKRLGISQPIKLVTCSKCGIEFNSKISVLCKSCKLPILRDSRLKKMVMIGCTVCGVPFARVAYHHRKTCSQSCHNILTSMNAKKNPNCGGETNYKRFIYNGVSMDSSWEVEIATLMDLLQIKWVRSKKLCLWWVDSAGGQRRYHPDFYLPDYGVYLDTKNKYLMKMDADKIARVRAGNKVTLVVGTLLDVEAYVLRLCCPN